MDFKHIIIDIVLKPCYTYYYFFKVKYHNRKEILQDKHITMDNGEKHFGNSQHCNIQSVLCVVHIFGM